MGKSAAKAKKTRDAGYQKPDAAVTGIGGGDGLTDGKAMAARRTCPWASTSNPARAADWPGSASS